MLDHLKLIGGEDVQVEIRAYELVIRKNIPPEPLDESSMELPRMLHEKIKEYTVVPKD